MLLPHAIKVTTAPAATPVSLADLKSHLLVEHDLDDALLNVLLKLATAHVQTAANLYLLPHTVEIGFAELPECHEPVDLPVWPLRSVGSLSYLDSNGATATVSGVQQWLDHRPPLLAPAATGTGWPATQAGAIRAAWVTCEVGYATAAAVPEEAKHAIRLIAAHNYANKGDGKDPTGEMGIPPAAERFITYLRQDAYR